MHSLLDGREFGTCDASPGGAAAFDGMEVLSLEDVRPNFLAFFLQED